MLAPLLALISLVSIGATGCERPNEAAHPHVLLITVDTLRADHTSLLDYPRDTTPRIREFFAEGRIFERAYATEANTSPSVISILSGRYPQSHGVRLLFQKIDPSLVLLPDYLRNAGYRTAAVVSNLVLTDEAIGLANRFDYFDDFVDEPEESWSVYQRVAARTTTAAIGWLADQSREAGPLFLWVHYIDPHGPYRPPKDATTHYSHDVPLPIDLSRVHHGHHRDGLRDGLEYIDRYDEEIAYTDREVGRLLDAFEDLGFADESITVFTADHGETMMDFSLWFAHGYHVFEPIIHVPLAIRASGVSAKRISAPVSLVSILPTILDLAGIEAPMNLDGESLAVDTPDEPVFAEATADWGHQWRALIRGNEKWVAEVLADGSTDQRIRYPVAREGEVAERWSDDDPVGARLLERIKRDPDPAGVPVALEKGIAITAPKVAPGLGEATLEKLRALGYVE